MCAARCCRGCCTGIWVWAGSSTTMRRAWRTGRAGTGRRTTRLRCWISVQTGRRDRDRGEASAGLDMIARPPPRMGGRGGGGGGGAICAAGAATGATADGLRGGVSHELRTPLTVIRTAAFNLRGRLANRPDGVERYGALIQAESEKLVEQVLRFASIEAGHAI